MNKSYVWLVLAFAVLAAGCNTMSGLGKDVSKLGDKIEQKADEQMPDRHQRFGVGIFADAHQQAALPGLRVCDLVLFLRLSGPGSGIHGSLLSRSRPILVNCPA